MKLGRRAPQPKPSLRLAQFVAGVPDLPRRADYLRELDGGWAMLGNDIAGDCEAVRWANHRRLTTALLTGSESYPDQQAVWDLYRTQNPDFDPAGGPHGPGSDADGGMETQTLLSYLHHVGGPDGVKAVAYARVDPMNEAEVDAAVGIFGAVWVDSLVQQAQMEQFRAGAPWDYVAGSPQLGGHATLGGGYSYGRLNSIGSVTWADTVRMTDLYRQSCIDALWVVIWPEHLYDKAFRQGIDTSKLSDYFRAITGRSLDLAA